MLRQLTSERVRAYVESIGGPVSEAEVLAWAPTTPAQTVRVYLRVRHRRRVCLCVIMCPCVCACKGRGVGANDRAQKLVAAGRLGTREAGALRLYWALPERCAWLPLLWYASPGGISLPPQRAR